MTVIIVSFAFASVTLGMLLGKLLKRAAKVGTVEPPIEHRALQRERYGEIKAATPAGVGARG